MRPFHKYSSYMYDECISIPEPQAPCLMPAIQLIILQQYCDQKVAHLDLFGNNAALPKQQTSDGLFERDIEKKRAWGQELSDREEPKIVQTFQDG